MRKPWTEEEIRILREGYQAETPRKQLALSRSLSAIHHKAMLLGLQKRNITQEEKGQMQALRDKGQTLAQIAAATRRSIKSILEIVPRKNRRWTIREIREIRRLWAAGWGQTRIAARFSTETTPVTPSNLNRFIRDLPPHRQSRPWTDTENSRLRELWAANLSIAEIGRQMNRPRSSVQGHARRLGLEKQP